MNYLLLVIFNFVNFIDCKSCRIKCKTKVDKPVCGFDFDNSTYKLFPSYCAMMLDTKCNGTEYIPVKMSSCVPNHNIITRKMYGESCPAFCPEYYRPVCGASTIRDYKYRTFSNGCYLDMINCRGNEDYGYVEVPLKYCQDHLMKNIFKEQMVISNFHNYREYLS